MSAQSNALPAGRQSAAARPAPSVTDLPAAIFADMTADVTPLPGVKPVAQSPAVVRDIMRAIFEEVAADVTPLVPVRA